MKIAVSTGGGDAPGLNAAIRALTLSAIERGHEVFGIRHGFRGLLDAEPDGIVRLDRARVRGIAHLGGTILGAANRGDPFHYPRAADGSPSLVPVDRAADLLQRFRDEGFDVLVSLGGDGSLRIAHELLARGLPRIVALPKTIDNDVRGTDTTFGFDTAVSVATDAIDRVHTTAESHERVVVVEVMGRNAGFIALRAGLAGGADVVLIPEIPYALETIAAKIRQREARGRSFAIVVAAEGARPAGGEASLRRIDDPFHAPRLGGVGERLAQEIGALTGKDARALVLGHLQRGGSPTSYDRVLATRYGGAGARAVDASRESGMIALRDHRMVLVPFSEVLGTKSVPLDCDTIESARGIGICFGDEPSERFR